MASTTAFAFAPDLTKMFGSFNFPTADASALAEAQRRNFEALLESNQAAIAGLQEAVRRQAELMGEMLEQNVTLLSELVGAGAPEEKIARQTALLKEGFAKGSIHARELTELLAKANGRATEIVTRRVGEILDEIAASVKAPKKAETRAEAKAEAKK